MDRRGRRDRCGRIRSGSCYEAECLKQKTSRGVDRGFVRVCGEGLAVGMALSAKLTMRQGQTMVLTPQLLQAIKLLQMPNLELTQFIENELASNPLLERAEEREDPNPEPQDGAGVADAPAEPGDWASEALETDAGGPRRQSRHRGRQRLRLGPHCAGAQVRPSRRLERPRLDGPRRRRGRRRSPRPRSLCRRGPQPARPSSASGRDPPR